MKLSAKKLGSILSILFIAGMIVVAWVIFKFPESLIYRANVIDLSDMEKINPVMNELKLITGLVFFIGLLAIVNLVNAQKSKGAEIAQEQSNQSEEKTELEETEEEIEEIFEGVDLDQINLILAEKEDHKIKLNNVLNKICNHIEAVQGALYVVSKENDVKYIELIAAYAYQKPESEVIKYEFGEGLAGQVAKEGKLVNINEVPEGYIKVFSGLGNTSPDNLLLIPMKKGKSVIGVVEIASFRPFRKADISYLEQVFNLAAEKTLGGKSTAAGKSSSASKSSTKSAVKTEGTPTIEATEKDEKSGKIEEVQKATTKVEKKNQSK